MRVLHLTPELPFEPGGGGGRGREYFLCRRLVDLGHQVLNISPVVPDEAHHAESLRQAGVENWTVVRPRSQAREAAEAVLARPVILGTALVSPVRALEMRVFWREIGHLVERAVEEWRPDVVVIGHDMAADWSSGLPRHLPAVLTLHNLTWHWYLSRARLATPGAALLLRAEAARYRRFLLRRIGRFSAAVCVSTNEAAELRRRAPGLPVSVIPTGVDTEVMRPGPDPAGPPRLVFTGTLGYPPNTEGIAWFVDRVWPRVLEQVPGALLDIVGRDPPPAVTALGGRSGVTVVGPVPVMGPYFDRAHVAIVPILTGAGIRVKIVEAMAMGRAVVSTSLGWEGLPNVEPGRHLLVADDPEAFAAGTIALLTDAERRRRLAGEARRLAETDYDWRALGDAQEQILTAAVARGR